MKTASDVMTTDVTSISQTATVRDALRALRELDVRHLPVVKEGHELVGMLSDRDLAPLADDPQRLAGPVSRLMSADVVFAHPETELSELIDLMSEQRVGAIPVVDLDGRLAGIVSYLDILRAVPKELEERA